MTGALGDAALTRSSVGVLRNRNPLGRRRRRDLLHEISRVGIHNGVVGIALLLFDDLEALGADFHAVDECFGSQRIRQALQ
jgi:hypothetical protein